MVNGKLIMCEKRVKDHKTRHEEKEMGCMAGQKLGRKIIKNSREKRVTSEKFWCHVIVMKGSERDGTAALFRAVGNHEKLLSTTITFDVPGWLLMPGWILKWLRRNFLCLLLEKRKQNYITQKRNRFKYYATAITEVRTIFCSGFFESWTIRMLKFLIK